ncbi:hypothetical protein ZIOFF_071830 [Zingiber officinale]|uniref:RRM domain-containing protein n=1 Tax=Zingiber officinale TaxID=94328 RepID=A0A8J5C224_ZINOF|nr:hypothetical protein ZIOFF_071830 [Zingiber officinale]
MSQTKEVKYTSRSVTPPRNRHSKSISPSRSRSRSRSRSQDSAGVGNPGNNLYVTGLSTRVNNSDLEKYFNKEGKVLECNVIVDPRTRESRGFAFVTMETLEDANRCVKYLHHSVLEGRLITVEKAKRKRGRTPTPGKYRGARDRRGPWTHTEKDLLMLTQMEETLKQLHSKPNTTASRHLAGLIISWSSTKNWPNPVKPGSSIQRNMTKEPTWKILNGQPQETSLIASGSWNSFAESRKETLRPGAPRNETFTSNMHSQL